MVIQKEVYAKPGELIQGVLNTGNKFLLSNKSSRIFKSTTTISTGQSTASSIGLKSQQAIDSFRSAMIGEGRTIDISQIQVQQSSNIPKGKGLGSSSADVLGVLQGLNLFFDAKLSEQRLYELAASIEPTDPCLHEENLLFDPLTGKVLKSPEVLPYRLIYFDTNVDQTVDTVDLSRQIHYSQQEKLQFKCLHEDMLKPIYEKDYFLFFKCITKSSEINNDFLPKPKFNLLKDFATKNNCALFIAHSGTFMGLVIHPDEFEITQQKAIPMIKENWNTEVYLE